MPFLLVSTNTTYSVHSRVISETILAAAFSQSFIHDHHNSSGVTVAHIHITILLTVGKKKKMKKHTHPKKTSPSKCFASSIHICHMSWLWCFCLRFRNTELQSLSLYLLWCACTMFISWFGFTVTVLAIASGQICLSCVNRSFCGIIGNKNCSWSISMKVCVCWMCKCMQLQL